MRRGKVLALAIVFASALSGSAHAVMVDTYDWVGEGSIPLARVTTVYYSAAEISGSALDFTPGMADNLFLYSVQNLASNASIREFGVSNPDGVNGVLFSPAGWSGSGNQAFLWQTELAAIAPDSTLSGFALFADGDRGRLTSPPYNVNQIGSIEFIDGEGGEFEIVGPVTGPVSVPEPASLAIFGMAFFGLPLLRRSGA